MWSNGGTSNTITNVAGDDYSVTITDAAGCQALAIASVANVDGPSVSISSNNPICAGQTVTLNAVGNGGQVAGNYTYLWAPGNEITNSITVVVGANAVYSVTITDDQGCTATASVIGSPIPNPSVNSTTICAGATATLTVSNCTGTIWSNGESSSSILVSPTATTTYSVTCTEKLCEGVAVATVTVVSNPTCNASVTNTLSCGVSNGAVSVEATGGLAPYTYLWSNGLTNQAITGLSANTYTVTVTDAKYLYHLL